MLVADKETTPLEKQGMHSVAESSRPTTWHEKQFPQQLFILPKIAQKRPNVVMDNHARICFLTVAKSVYNQPVLIISIGHSMDI